MSFHRFLTISAAAAGFLTAAFAQPAAETSQPTTITRDYVFPPVTLASSETARVIVVNTAPPATGSNPAPSCMGTITFLSSGTAPTVSAVTFTLPAGQFAFADLPYSKSGLSTSPGEVVGKVASSLAVGSQAPCSLGMALVVFDTTSGVGHLVLGNASAQTGPIPIPIPFQGR